MAGRAFSGAALTIAAEKLRQIAAERRRDAWPYVSIYPPPNADTVHQIGTVANPGAGNSAVVLEYLVPTGNRFYLRSILQVFGVGASFTPGDALWTVSVNKKSGSATQQSMPVQGLVNVPFPLGSLVAGTQWPLPEAYEFGELDIIRSTVANVNLVGNTFVSGFFGYLVPEP